MTRRNSLDELRDLQATITQQGYCTNAMIPAGSMALGSNVSDDENNNPTKNGSGEVSCGTNEKGGLLAKLKDTVAEYKIELYVPRIGLIPRKGELLEDFPSNKKEPSFWKSSSTPTGTEETHASTAKSIEKVQEIFNLEDLNLACTAYCDSEELSLDERTRELQQRRLSDSLSVLDTCAPPSRGKVTSDDFLSHLLDSELPSADLSFSSISSVRSTIVGCEAVGCRRTGIVRGNMDPSRRRSSNLLELDNAQRGYGGLTSFGTK